MHAIRISLLSIALLAAGCADETPMDRLSPEARVRLERELASDPTPTDPDQPTHEVRFAADFYLTSPAQVSPPDGRLSTGQRVILLEHAGGFSRIRDVEAREMWIASDALRALSSDQKQPRLDPPANPTPESSPPNPAPAPEPPAPDPSGPAPLSRALESSAPALASVAPHGPA
jgi:hypothetical protein